MSLLGAAAVTRTLRLEARERHGLPRHGEPATTGVPLARGLARHPESVGLRGPDGWLPLQAEAAERWPDGTIRWLLLDFPATVEANRTLELEVVPDSGAEAPAPDSPLRVNRTGGGFFIDTGAAQFSVDADAFLPLRSARVGGVERIDPAQSGWNCVDAEDNRWTPHVTECALETEGPLRTVIRVDGKLLREESERPLLTFTARLTFWSGKATAGVRLSVRNPRRAEHPGGHWELGDGGSVFLKDLSLRLGSFATRRISFSTDAGSPPGAVAAESLELYQESSGGENWRSPVHVDRNGDVPMKRRGYRLRIGGEEREGLRATPRVALHDDAGGVGISVRHFWENFPKAVEADRHAVTLRFFPKQFEAGHEIQGGEQKTHEFWMSFGPEAASPAADAWRSPLRVVPAPETVLASGISLYLLPPRDGDVYERLAAQAVDGPDPFPAKRERADEYGWRHFGELWADHESKFDDSGELFVSHYNNQYDVVYGTFLQFARTGDERWLEIMEPLARHVMDIDVYHTDEDRPAYNRGLFWHTAHYVRAGRATHRSYPRGTVGGGPDNEHNYASGFAHYYFLTGDRQGREACIERAQWILDADDGDKDRRFRRLHRGPTGLASKTRDAGFHGPGRGAGNSIQVLLDAWRLTGTDRFLAKAEELLRRTIHPSDDPDALGLADSENRWSYTVHLQAVGRLLDELAEAEQLGELYAYARESLLRYARWMAENERPALDFPDRLEFPTETWAAQDLRKSEVFRFAMLHSDGDERERFRERAEYFHHHSLETLDGFDTKHYTRPVSLLLRYGLMQAYFDAHPGARRPDPEWTGTVADPTAFVPQKTAAIAKAKRIAFAGAAVIVAAAAAARFL